MLALIMLDIERCRARAASCEKVVEQDSAPIEMRMRFARKASFFRIMAKLAALDETRRIEGAGLRIPEEFRSTQPSSGHSSLIHIALGWCRISVKHSRK
jgi:hypothetical protein